jgi:hypothetical protein
MTANRSLPADSRAVLISVSAYEYAELPPIRAARNSVQAIQSLLADPALCGWPPELITVIANPISASDLAARIADLAEATTGVLLLYYVGHGVLSMRGELCLTVTSTRPSRPKITGLPWETVAEELRTSPARIRLVILDCCFAGRAIEALGSDDSEGLADITHVDGVYTLAATTRNRTAHVPPADQQDIACTSFTGELQALIRSGIRGKPEQLTFSDIYSELRQRLRAKGLPAPSQRGTDTAHQFPFTVNAAARVDSAVHITQPQGDSDGGRETIPESPEPGHRVRPRQASILTAALQATWSIDNGYMKVSALVRIAEAMAATDPDRAARLTVDAERIARSIPEEDSRASALADIAKAVAGTDPDRAARLAADAERVARSIPETDSMRPYALANVARAMVHIDTLSAEGIARSIPADDLLADIAEAVAGTDPDRAESIARSIPAEDLQASALARVAGVIARTDPDRAEGIALSVLAWHLKAAAVARVVGAAAAAHSDQAERIAQSIFDDHVKAPALIDIAEAVAGTDPDRAARLTAEAERLAIGPFVYGGSGEEQRVRALIRVAEAVVGTDPGRAAPLTADAERIARSMVTGFQVESTLVPVALAVARLDLSRAEDIARSISDEAFKASALADIAEAVADTDPDRGERIARSISDEQGKASALARVARAVAGTDPDRAEQIAGSIPDPYLKALALAGVAEASQAPNQPSVAAGHSDGTDVLTDLLYRDAVDIYERARREVTIPRKDGSRQKYAANRYKQQIDKAHADHQLVSAIGRIVSRPTQGFGHLENAGRDDLMVETLVLERSKPYHRLFPAPTVQMAQERMAEYRARHPKPPE